MLRSSSGPVLLQVYCHGKRHFPSRWPNLAAGCSSWGLSTGRSGINLGCRNRPARLHPAGPDSRPGLASTLQSAGGCAADGHCPSTSCRTPSRTTPWPGSSNRLWAYTGENFISPTASKICPRHNPTTTCKGNAHGLTPKLNIYTKI